MLQLVYEGNGYGILIIHTFLSPPNEFGQGTTVLPEGNVTPASAPVSLHPQTPAGSFTHWRAASRSTNLQAVRGDEGGRVHFRPFAGGTYTHQIALLNIVLTIMPCRNQSLRSHFCRYIYTPTNMIVLTNVHTKKKLHFC